MDGVDMSFGEVNGSAGMASAGGSGVINTVSVDAIEEFKSTGNASSAEYGRAGAGVLTVVTRPAPTSGTARYSSIFRTTR